MADSAILHCAKQFHERYCRGAWNDSDGQPILRAAPTCLEWDDLEYEHKRTDLELVAFVIDNYRSHNNEHRYNIVIDQHHNNHDNRPIIVVNDPRGPRCGW
jgi:hypothetical protein